MQMWPDLFQKAKDGGLDVIQTYVFWNGHEPSPGNVMQIFIYMNSASIQFINKPFSCFFICFSLIQVSYNVEKFQYYFEDRFDLVKFIKLAQQAGLYVHLRIGPYVCAEWNYG